MNGDKLSFLCRAKKATYAGHGAEADPSRPASHDLIYSEDKPYRGPEYFTDGTYVFAMTVDGDMDWFQGYEEITTRGHQVYELYFHGGTVI